LIKNAVFFQCVTNPFRLLTIYFYSEYSDMLVQQTLVDLENLSSLTLNVKRTDSSGNMHHLTCNMTDKA